jgi:hypothetical protein
MTDRDRQPFWLWLNLLSLDAPLVALIWQHFLSRCYPAPLFSAGRCVLGLTVWAIYIADRLLDVRGAPREDEPRHHRFYRSHRRAWAIALALIVFTDVGLTIFWLRPIVFVHGLIVAGASVVYLATFTGAGARHVIWKKSAAAILFSAGVFLVASANATGPLTQLLGPWITFALLCAANLVLIERWKRLQSTKRICPALVAFGLLCAIAGQNRWFTAISLSSLALAAIGYLTGRVSVEARRVLADFALFTPLLFP